MAFSTKKLFYSMLFVGFVFIQGLLLTHDHESHHSELGTCFSCLYSVASVAAVQAGQAFAASMHVPRFEQLIFAASYRCLVYVLFLARAPPLSTQH